MTVHIWWNISTCCKLINIALSPAMGGLSIHSICYVSGYGTYGCMYCCVGYEEPGWQQEPKLDKTGRVTVLSDVPLYKVSALSACARCYHFSFNLVISLCDNQIHLPMLIYILKPRLYLLIIKLRNVHDRKFWKQKKAFQTKKKKSLFACSYRFGNFHTFSKTATYFFAKILGSSY